MRHETQQFVEDVLPILAPPLVGVAVFLLIWLLFRGPLRRERDRVFPTGAPARRAPEGAHAPRGSSTAGGLAPAARGRGVGRRAEPLDGAPGKAALRPPDAAGRDQHLARWHEVEAQFACEPAAALAGAERLLWDLARVRGSRPVVGALIRAGQSRTGVVHPPTLSESDADFGAALAEAVRVVLRLIRRHRGARRGTAAVRHPDARADDLRERMDLYRGVLEQLLAAERAEPNAPGVETPAGAGGPRDARDERPVGSSAERAGGRQASVRWLVLQLLLNVASALAVLALVFWVLGLR